MSRSSKSATAAPVLVPKEFVKIAHYGTGKFASSPVMLTLPERLQDGGLSMLVHLDFALAFQEYYTAANSSGEVSNLNADMEWITHRWRTGQYDYVARACRDLIRKWHREDNASMLAFPRNATPEEIIADNLGELAAAAEFTKTPHDIDGTWMDHEAFPTWRSLLYGTTVTSGLVAGAITTGLLAPAPDYAMWWLSGLIVLRFRRPFNKLRPEAGLLENQAYYLYSKDYKERREFARRMARGMSQEEIVKAVAAKLRDELYRDASRELSTTISKELLPLATDQVKENSKHLELLTLAQDEAGGASADRDLFDAQQQLLKEIRSQR